MSYLYKTKGTCSSQIEVTLDGDIVKDVKLQRQSASHSKIGRGHDR